MKENYFKWNLRILIESFRKITPVIFLIVLIDFLFYSLISFALAIMGSSLSALYDKIPPAEIATSSDEIIAQAASSMKEFYYTTILSIILFIIIFIVLSGIFKSIIWALTSKTRITLNYILGFSLMNSIFVVSWSLLSVAFILMLKNDSAVNFAFAFLLIIIYFGIISYSIFIKTQKIISIRQAIKLGIKKLHLMLMPWAIIIFFLIIISNMIVAITSKYNSIYLNYFFTGILLLYFAVARYYLYGIILDIGKKQ